MAERSEAKRANREASRQKSKYSLTRSFASRFLLRYAHPFFAKLKLPTNWSLYPQELKGINSYVRALFNELKILF